MARAGQKREINSFFFLLLSPATNVWSSSKSKPKWTTAALKLDGKFVERRSEKVRRSCKQRSKQTRNRNEQESKRLKMLIGVRSRCYRPASKQAKVGHLQSCAQRSISSNLLAFAASLFVVIISICLLVIMVTSSADAKIEAQEKANHRNRENQQQQHTKIMIVKRSLATSSPHQQQIAKDKSTSLLPEFAGPIGNVTAVLGRDVRLVCTVDNLGSYRVSSVLPMSDDNY